MALGRDDRYIADALGRALAGAQVYWCSPQPASTAVNPPSPLAPTFTDLTGDTPLVQPVLADGFGHADAYLDDQTLFTVVVWHPLFGPNPIVLIDQQISGGGGGGSTLTPFQGTLIGTVDGVNKTFTLANGSSPLGVAPIWSTVVVWFNFPLVNGLGYTPAGTDTLTFANAPQPASGGTPADAIFAQGFTLS